MIKLKSQSLVEWVERGERNRNHALDGDRSRLIAHGSGSTATKPDRAGLVPCDRSSITNEARWLSRVRRCSKAQSPQHACVISIRRTRLTPRADHANVHGLTVLTCVYWRDFWHGVNHVFAGLGNEPGKQDQRSRSHETPRLESSSNM